ncbi:MAG: sugar ABC transporter permease, partial [Pseudomonadota bacterium]|nr:sugar ABC transporter permease [Pseudomonadota bacterium]
TLITQVPLAFFMAVILFKRRHRTRFLRSLVLFPQVLSIGAAGLLWVMIYHPQRGILNAALSLILPGDVRIAWLGSSATALGAVILASNWYYFGLHTLIFLAGMSGIPREYYDVLRLGSNRLRDELRHVTLPMLREQFLVSFILVISGSFGHVLGFVSILTNGGPAGSTELLGLYAIEIGFRAGRFGLASAITVVLLAVVLSIVIWPIVRVARTRLEYT